ncbi:MAG: DNA gyrase inhibitor YacG [Hyphomicrobiaceae bacterium]
MSKLNKAKCPICGQPTHQDFRPFCSRRCADVDLARWMNGVYAIPIADDDADEDGDDIDTEMSARAAGRGFGPDGSSGGER